MIEVLFLNIILFINFIFVEISKGEIIKTDRV